MATPTFSSRRPMNAGTVLSRAFQLSMRHKTLCLVGVVTAISLPFGGWFATFSGATWTLAYMSADASGATSRPGTTVSPQA